MIFKVNLFLFVNLSSRTLCYFKATKFREDKVFQISQFSKKFEKLFLFYNYLHVAMV